MPEPKVRMIPESDLLKLKAIHAHKEKQWQTERSQLSQRASQLENELKIAKANGDDSAEVEMVKKSLLDQARELEDTRGKLDEDLNSYKGREKEFRAREIASDMKSKGVEIDPQSLLEVEDMDKHSRDLLVDFQAKEIERLKGQPGTPESVFEHGSGGNLKKNIWDQTDEEFAATEKALIQKSLQKV